MKNTMHWLSLFLIFPTFLILTNELRAQTVPVIGLDDLENRIESAGDTSFIVNFWATWCGPCVKELPYFEQLHENSAGTNRKVLLVSLDFITQLDSKVIPFLKEKKLKSEVTLMDEGRPNEWIPRVSEKWSGALPATLFVNAQKKTRHFHEGSFEEGDLEKLLTKIGL